jgi:hypothetical protein
MTVWRQFHIGFEMAPLEIGGADVWKQKWRPVEGERPLLSHPAYPEQMHRYHVYEIGDNSMPFRFAACELSPGVWGFYIPDKTAN